MSSAVAPVRISFRHETGENTLDLFGLQARQVLQLMNRRETASQVAGKVGRSTVDTGILHASPARFLELVHDFRALSDPRLATRRARSTQEVARLVEVSMPRDRRNFGVPYGNRTRVAAVIEKRPIVIQRNSAAWIALYRT